MGVPGSCRDINILIFDDNSPFVLPLIRSFAGYSNIKLDVVLCTNAPTGVFRHSRYLRKIRKINCPRTEITADEILKVVNELDTDMIIPTKEWISRLLYNLRKALEPFVRIHPIPEPEILKIIEDKWELNRWLRDQGFPYSGTAGSSDDWKGGFPAVLKPRIGTGGEGIVVVKEKSELEPALERVRRTGHKYFIQEYIEGHDIDISFFALDGKIVYHTIQKAIITGSMQYSRGIEFIYNQEFFDLAKQIVRKLDYSGIGHLDFRYDIRKQAYVLIDFNARYWSTIGGSGAMGINFPYRVACYTMQGILYPDRYRCGHYYLSLTALRVFWKNLVKGSKIPIRLKDTDLISILKDPKPELSILWKRLFNR